jgi:hypothetical protein
MQHAKDNPQKDNFHSAIFGIDKTVGSGIVHSTFLVTNPTHRAGL